MGRKGIPEQLVAEVLVKDIDAFKEYIKMIKDILLDDRIDKEVRKEYYLRYLSKVGK